LIRANSFISKHEIMYSERGCQIDETHGISSTSAPRRTGTAPNEAFNPISAE
jgi:hypothetical protein